ncbi:phosphoenolpyruvate protein kinase [Alteromonadales bacterium alter-6D02]|nr:phosphoenolpyruvate protein kinase [Alteromonadales bacterium alter-6D02]
MQLWIGYATQRTLLLRSFKVSAIVGSLLVLINQGDVIANGQLTVIHYLKILLTYCVPFCVATYSSVAALLNQQNAQGKDDHV